MYKITIEKIDKTNKMVQGEWGVIDKRPYTEEEAKKAYEFKEFKGELKEVRGYRPNVEKTIETETTILTQTIDELDLVSVIKAINKIER